MSTIISVPVSYAMYEIEEDMFEMLTDGSITQPPLIVLEVMTLNGQAKRIGTVGSVLIGAKIAGEEDEDEPPEGEGPWMDDDEEE